MDPCFNLLAYRDDHAIKKELDPNQAIEERNVINLLTKNTTNIKEWMNSVRLKMNNFKLEFLIFGNRRQVNKCTSDGLRIVKYLGAWSDSKLSLKTHVKKKCASAMLNVQRINNIQTFLTRDSCTKLVVSLCLSHLNSSNSILYGLPNSTIQQMQNIQNYRGKLVLGRGKYDSNNAVLAELH